MSKHPKGLGNNHRSNVHQDDRKDNERRISGDVHIAGHVEAILPRDLVETYKSADRQSNAREKGRDRREHWRFVVEIITVAFVVLVALVGMFQAYQTKRSTDATGIAAIAARDSVQTARDQFRLENRAYLSVGDPENIFDSYFVVKIPIFNNGHVPTNGDHLKLWFMRLGKNLALTEVRVFDYETTAHIPPGKDAYFYTITMPTTPVEDQGRKFGPEEGIRLKGMMDYDSGFGDRDTLYMCYDYIFSKGAWRNCSGQSMNIWLNDATKIDPNTEPKQSR